MEVYNHFNGDLEKMVNYYLKSNKTTSLVYKANKEIIKRLVDVKEISLRDKNTFVEEV